MIKDDILKKIEKAITENVLDLSNKDIVFRRCFNETWFSDTLAWLLNPKGSHQLGVKFANEFLKTLAKSRSNKSEDYQNRKSMLKWGKSGRGTTATNFSLSNASSIREFHLAKSIKKRTSRGARYCDIVFIDLDLVDGLFLVIENKLFTSNHPGQLEEYYQLVENKFRRVKIREYVYLTLNGIKPIQYDKDISKNKLYKYWVNMSWNKDILNIITKLQQDDNPHEDVTLLKSILDWLNRLNQKSISSLVEELRRLLLKTATACLLDELQRLGEGKSGSWKEGKTNADHISIFHTSSPKRPLFVELLPNFTITVQSRKSKRPLFEKIIVPFGVQPEQIFNLIDIAARDVYHYHFENSTNLYLSDKRRLSSTRSEIKRKVEQTFKFVYRYHYELKIILASSKYVWQAHQFENKDTNEYDYDNEEN